MENFKSIEHVLENMDTTFVYKSRNSIWCGILFLIAGAILFILLGVISWAPTSIYPYIILITGITTGIIGLVKVLYRKSYFASTENNQKLKRFEIYFDTVESDKLVRLYDNGKISDLHLLKSSERGGLKISVMATKDLKICFSQVSKYVPFEFVPLTSTVQHSLEEAKYLLDLKH